VRVGVVGCGAISGAYLEFARRFSVLDIAAVCDLDVERARAKAEAFGVPRACGVEELLRDGSIEVVLNLTVPGAHAEVSLAAIEAGKHVFSEKPLAINTAEGRRVLESARARGVRVGCAPDTFMGAGLQTARKAIDDGWIGRPVAFTAFMMCRGHESWHPDPEFYYQAGGGPMMDMGPYYLTALLNLLGPMRRLSGAASIAVPQRVIGSEPKRGRSIVVRTPDHVCGTIEFAGGAVGTIVTSFATHFPTYDAAQPMTIYGTEGTLRVADPNRFDGVVHVRREGEEQWQEAESGFARGYGRAVGLADLALAIRSKRQHRASGEQAYAVLEAMEGLLGSAADGRAFHPTAPYARPEVMPQGPLEQ
jgi:predicted dehydrogenase